MAVWNRARKVEVEVDTDAATELLDQIRENIESLERATRQARVVLSNLEAATARARDVQRQNGKSTGR